MIHGILYFIYPAEISDATSYIKYIKYIIIVIIMTYTVKVIKIRDFITVLSILCMAFILFIFANNFQLNLFFVLFVLPIVVMYLLKSELTSNLLYRASKYSYVIISLFAYLEYYILNGIFSRFSHGSFGYRGSSILVNPNNFGITVVFISIFLMENVKNKLIKNVIYVNTFILIFFSMSKTAMILIFFYILFKNIKLYISLFVPLFLVATLINLNTDFINSDKYFESMLIRNSYNSLFLDSASTHILFPFIDTYQYVDNIYLQIWGNFSLIGLVLYLFVNLCMFAMLLFSRQYTHILVLFLFLLTGYTTNFLYIWPLSYLYWGFCFYHLHAFYMKKHNRKALMYAKNNFILHF